MIKLLLPEARELLKEACQSSKRVISHAPDFHYIEAGDKVFSTSNDLIAYEKYKKALDELQTLRCIEKHPEKMGSGQLFSVANAACEYINKHK